MGQFTIKGVVYQARPIRTLEAWTLLKKLSPFLPILTTHYKAEQLAGGKIPTIDEFLLTGPRIAMALSNMPDADAAYVRDACLSVVQVQQGPAAFDIFKNGMLMYDNIGLFDVLEMCWHVLEETFRPFSSDLKALLERASGSTAAE